jgi:hypothetical protein
MANRFKSTAQGKMAKQPKKRTLTLYPLTLETALGAALLTGPPPRDASEKARKKPVDKVKRLTRKI